MLILLTACSLLTTDNVVTNYEWFHNASEAIESRQAQIRAEHVLVDAETDADEARRLRVDLGGMQQSCRDLTSEYNARADSVTRDIFRSGRLPTSFDLEDCE